MADQQMTPSTSANFKNDVSRLMDFIWSSGLTDPMECVKQITYLMFLKIMDDQEIVREKNAAAFGDPLDNPLFDDSHVCCRWSVFKHYEPKAMFDNMHANVFPFIKETLPAKKSGSALAQSMKNAIFQIPEPSTLTNLIEVLDKMDFENMDAMGDAYEQLLDYLSAAGTAGQFRTPRHIIDMMVKMMKPTLDDNMCDPAMGTAGFICGTVRYTKEHFESEIYGNEKKGKHFVETMFHGYDSDPTMFNIGTMNLFLHGVEAANISRRNSISGDNKIRDEYSLILANPPFKGKVDEDVIAKDLREMTKTTQTELLFLSLFIKSLKIGGRCASIVPEGVLFRSNGAYEAIRKELVENQRLQAVIKMPSGVFKPYSGVSTAILIFTKTNNGGTDKVWFYDMKADGLSLNDLRAPVDENDIPDILARWENLAAEESRTRKDQSFFVPKEEIVANGYDFSMSKYKELDVETVEYPPTSEILNELEQIESEIADEFESLKGML